MGGMVVLASKPEWGNLDILEACGASDSGSNPGSGALRIVKGPPAFLRP